MQKALSRIEAKAGKYAVFVNHDYGGGENFILSGHTHGGQVSVPYFTKKLLPNDSDQFKVSSVARGPEAGFSLWIFVVKKYNHKASQGKVPDDKENISNRNFKAETINRKWVTAITYIHVRK